MDAQDVAIRELVDFVLDQAGILNGRYIGKNLINCGSFGAVFAASDFATNQIVALKGVLKSSSQVTENSLIKVDERSEEKEIHELLGSHDHIVSLSDAFETDRYKFMVLEYCAQGDLYEAIRLDKGPKETEHVRDFMLQLVDAVHYLHSSGVAHRDIKPENIFLLDNGNMKLGDFGLATRDLWSYEAAVGSDRYMAPEQYDHKGEGLATQKADIWSIGICLLNILFCRNPFQQPADSDPIFSDFVCDRQALFDVFPNMSQDTFDVLTHCLAIDPAKRSLEATREALCRVVSFTTDDESLDEFCTDSRDVVPVTANREPLRTPSIASPVLEHVDTFPWRKLSPVRQLSCIRDTESEDLFPGSEVSAHDWCSTSKADTVSIESVVDSGLGVSLGSDNIEIPQSPNSKARPMLIAESLPTRGLKSLSSFLGKKKAFESKSWSDLQDEEEEEMAERERERELARQSRPMRPFGPSRVPTANQFDSESEGRSTPRAVPAQLNNNDETPRRSSVASQASHDDGISEHTGFMFEDHALTPPAQRYSPPPKRGFFSEKIDKWTALGERRRGGAPETPRKEEASATPETPTPTKRSTFRPSTWKYTLSSQGTARNSTATPNGTALSNITNNKRPVTRAGAGNKEHTIYSNKQWSMSTDWRNDHLSTSPNAWKPRNLHTPLDGIDDMLHSAEEGANGKWVGGWRNPLRL